MLSMNSYNKPLRPYSIGIMELEPVPDDDDELIQAINDDVSEQWDLSPVPDTEQLGAFWSEVSDDLRSGSDWQFTDEGE